MRRQSTNRDIERLIRMAATGAITLAEADRAMGLYEGFARYWAHRLGLTFYAGHKPLMDRCTIRHVRLGSKTCAVSAPR